MGQNLRCHKQHFLFDPMGRNKAMKHDYRKPTSRCLLRISSLYEVFRFAQSISERLVCKCTPPLASDNRISKIHWLDNGTQLEAWLHKSSTRSDGSNARSPNGPLRWPAPGQAKETLDSLLRSLIRLHAEQAHICSLLWGASSWSLMWSCNNRLLGNLLWHNVPSLNTLQMWWSHVLI